MMDEPTLAPEPQVSSGQLMLDMLNNHLVLFAPRTAHGLKLDYPELKSIPEFRDLGKYDMLFVWAMGCRSSPFTEIEDHKERIKWSVRFAYPEGDRRKRTSTFLNKLPDKISAAVTRMERFNLEARVTEYVLMKQIRDNIAVVSMQDISGMDDKARGEYFSQMKTTQALMADQRSRIEGMDLGISEEGETLYKEAVDVWSEYIQNHDPDKDPD
jgi:hypothetical protein